MSQQYFIAQTIEEPFVTEPPQQSPDIFSTTNLVIICITALLATILTFLFTRLIFRKNSFNEQMKCLDFQSTDQYLELKKEIVDTKKELVKIQLMLSKIYMSKKE